MSNLEKINPQEFGLQEAQVAQIEKDFTPLFTEITTMQTIYSDFVTKEITPDVTKEAKELRIKARDIRTKGIDPIHKANKAYHLAAGRYVDAWRNKYNALVEQMESGFLKIENYFVEIEKARIAELKANRLAALIPFQGVEPIGIELMSEDVWNTYIGGCRAAHEARIKSEQEAEDAHFAKQKADEEAREAQRLENERLKTEAAEREKQIEAERAAAAKAKAEADRKIREAQEAAKKSEEDKIKAEQEAKAKEQSRIDLEKAEAEKTAALGDRPKFIEMRKQLVELANSFEFKSEKAKAAHTELITLILG